MQTKSLNSKSQEETLSTIQWRLELLFQLLTKTGVLFINFIAEKTEFLHS